MLFQKWHLKMHRTTLQIIWDMKSLNWPQLTRVLLILSCSLTLPHPMSLSLFLNVTQPCFLPYCSARPLQLLRGANSWPDSTRSIHSTITAWPTSRSHHTVQSELHSRFLHPSPLSCHYPTLHQGGFVSPPSLDLSPPLPGHMVIHVSPFSFYPPILRHRSLSSCLFFPVPEVQCFTAPFHPFVSHLATWLRSRCQVSCNQQAAELGQCALSVYVCLSMCLCLLWWESKANKQFHGLHMLFLCQTRQAGTCTYWCMCVCTSVWQRGSQSVSQSVSQAIFSINTIITPCPCGHAMPRSGATSFVCSGSFITTPWVMVSLPDGATWD